MGVRVAHVGHDPASPGAEAILATLADTVFEPTPSMGIARIDDPIADPDQALRVAAWAVRQPTHRLAVEPGR